MPGNGKNRVCYFYDADIGNYCEWHAVEITRTLSATSSVCASAANAARASLTEFYTTLCGQTMVKDTP